MISDAIGGYFELELNRGIAIHKDAIALNTARNAIEYILIARKYQKVYVPFFTCDVVLEPFQKLNIDYEFYKIDENLEPIFDFEKVLENQAFLYTNYFGLKDEFIKVLAEKSFNLVIDNAHSFFSQSLPGVDTFYSARKFFGVADGGYLYCSAKLKNDYEQDMSYGRISHLLIRADTNAETAYLEFIENDKKLVGQPIKKMSNLTMKLLKSIDYESTKVKRKENFSYLHKFLKNDNKLKIKFLNSCVPMVYPFWSNNKKLKQVLLNNRVYCATYWPNVKEWCEEGDLELKMVDEIIHLPIDQRYGEKEMEFIINIILNV